MDSLFETFKARAETVSAEVHRLATQREAFDFVIALLLEQGVEDSPGRRALWAGGSLLAGVGKRYLTSETHGLGFEVTREAAAEAKVGISQMDWAISDTGTLVQNATAVEQRLVSTLPEIHIALIASHKMVPDLATALSRINPNDAAYLTFITGPSRTADIERVLTIGVHGPERLIIVLVDQLEE